ncbi:cl- channel voltage-gated family protein [Nitritalea halalkaliphila LW7]|uniref:Cl-channel voltage-gated family protein n=1 Tax=Nitritalea halalkaliphila LW7 TaxID=1189621 RepID=I5C784_9BACT|nr:cl- channel voltage-gated family protein [Nitritalea halalkaliphila LW7]
MAAQTLLSKLLIWRLRHLSTKNFVLLLSAVIGIISGLAAVFLKWAVHAIQHFLTQDFNAAYANFFYIIYPLIGISLAYIVGNYLLRDVGGHGIPDVLYAISKQNSLIPRVKMFSRVLTSALTVGFGGSVGLEAPIVMTGSAIGSNVGLTMHLNAKKRTLLIGCGAAGAISAIFGAPIGAVIFAIEVILLEVSAGSFIPLLLASVMGSITALLFADSGSILEINLQDDFLAAHMPYYLLLGVFTGLVSLYFSRIVLRTEKLMGLLEEPAVKLLYGGAFIGLIIFFFPPIYGEGYETLNALIANDPARILQNSPFLSEVDKPCSLCSF